MGHAGMGIIVHDTIPLTIRIYCTYRYAVYYENELYYCFPLGKKMHLQSLREEPPIT